VSPAPHVSATSSAKSTNPANGLDAQPGFARYARRLDPLYVPASRAKKAGGIASCWRYMS
jgi:hypothetical protein